jgi:hypothetical protein
MNNATKMREDHETRPILLTSSRFIYVETFNSFYK